MHIEYIYIVIVGMIAGFLNVVSAGGSLLTLPVLIFLGISPSVANASNRVAIFCQNLFVTGMYQRKLMVDWKGAKFLIVPALLGSVAGSYIAAVIDGEQFRIIIGIILLLMIGVMLLHPESRLRKKVVGERKAGFHFAGSVGMFVAGMYGGFIQAGVGVILLFSLVQISGYGIKSANVLKVLVILCYTVIALGVFIYHDLIDYRVGLVLALGNVIGGAFGAKFSIHSEEKIINRFLIAVLFVSALKMFGVIDFLFDQILHIFYE